MTVQEQINAGFIKIDQYDWPEDFSHENGQYECWCAECGVKFLGHKRRVTCKVCSTHSKNTEQQVQPDNSPKMCEECGEYPADLPSKLCCGRDAYKEHLV